MKLVCDCGNEQKFDTINKDTGDENRISDDEGQYATIENFRFWETHDVVGVVCVKCGKALWLFT